MYFCKMSPSMYDFCSFILYFYHFQVEARNVFDLSQSGVVWMKVDGSPSPSPSQQHRDLSARQRPSSPPHHLTSWTFS